MNANEYELSHELEQELEGELEQELEGELVGELHELELDSESQELHELELDSESQELHELEAHEQEAEQFFGALARVASRAGRSPALRRLALSAARRVLDPGNFVDREFEAELESELNPVRRVYIDAMMEHMGHAAAEAESEQEAAEAFLPLMPLAVRGLPIAGKLAGKFGPTILRGVSRYIPRLTRGVTQLARTLYRNPTARSLMRLVPQVARATALELARRIASGRPLTGQQVTRILVQQILRVFADPRRAVSAWRRSRALDRRHHRAHPGAYRSRGYRPRPGRQVGYHSTGPRNGRARAASREYVVPSPTPVCDTCGR